MHLNVSNSEMGDTLLRASKKHILKLAQARLKKCVSVAPRLLVDDDPNDIHDLRVGTRRLQQIVRLLSPKPRRGKSRKVIGCLRDLRRDWGACRNFDVNLDLLREKLEPFNKGATRDAWDCVRGCISQLRAEEFDHARKRLRRLDFLAFIERTQRLFEAVKIADGEELDFGESSTDTVAKWHDAVVQAKSSRDPERLHILRIAGKRLRYRLEILAELEDGYAQSRVQLLKALQDELGRWHDWHVLLQLVEKLIEKPEFVRDHPQFQQILACDIDDERRKNNAVIDGILKKADMLQLCRTQ